MSEERSEEHAADEHSADGSEGNIEAASTAAAPAQRRTYSVLPWLAALLIVVLAGVALSPFWAPQLAPLLPWSTRPATSSQEDAALAERAAAIEQLRAAPNVNVDALKSAVNGLEQRVEGLETAGKGRLAASTADVEAIKSQIGGLTQRVGRLEGASGGDHQLEEAVAGTKTGLQNLEQRVAAVEAQSASRKASDNADLQNQQQELARLGTAATNLTNRVAALEQETQSQNASGLRTNAMLALLLVQMREAVEQSRPFPAEYSAFTALARDPALVAATEPLADAARNGVASRAALVKGLAELATRGAAASQPAPEGDLGERVLAQLRGLVTIRRIDGSAQTGSEAAVSDAEAAFARGDLAGAVAALDALTGPNAEAATPWLRMAHERLGVETALDRLQGLLTVRLGSAPPAHPASPSERPDGTSEKARPPS